MVFEMNNDRPEYIKCCLTGAVDDRYTWCGKHESEAGFCFTDAGHAALNCKQEGRLLLCRECRDQIVKAFDVGFEVI